MYSPEPSTTFSVTLIIRGHLLRITLFRGNLPDKKSGMLARLNTQLNPKESRQLVSMALTKIQKVSCCEGDK